MWWGGEYGSGNNESSLWQNHMVSMGKQQIHQRKGVCSPSPKRECYTNKTKDVHYIAEEEIDTWTEMVVAEMENVCRFKIYFGDSVREVNTIVSWVHSFLY